MEHKYIYRRWKNGRWNYIYDEKAHKQAVKPTTYSQTKVSTWDGHVEGRISKNEIPDHIRKHAENMFGKHADGSGYNHVNIRKQVVNEGRKDEKTYYSIKATDGNDGGRHPKQHRTRYSKLLDDSKETKTYTDYVDKVEKEINRDTSPRARKAFHRTQTQKIEAAKKFVERANKNAIKKRDNVELKKGEKAGVKLYRKPKANVGSKLATNAVGQVARVQADRHKPQTSTSNYSPRKRKRY